MGIFDGVLLCTDLDGTLANGKDINKVDAEAIRYFKENGGCFTLSTGRVLNYLYDIFNSVTPNTYSITLNGAVIISHLTNEVLKQGFLESNYLSALDLALSYKESIKEFFVYYENCTDSDVFSPDGYISKKQVINEAKRIHKIVFSIKNEIDAIFIEQEINRYFSKDFFCTRSWPTGVEILGKHNTKGEAVKLLKAKLGAKLLVCAGDFENDIPMIKEADIGYAVGNAHPGLKAVADKITVTQSEGAIYHIINDIEFLLRNK